jgi:PERQ amino acid-rich with GYF domain-containing protein
MLLSQIRREQLQQEQMMARNNLEFPGQFAGHGFDSLHHHRQSMNPPAPEVDHLLRVQFELEHQQRRQQQQLQQEQHRQQLQQEQHRQQLQQEQHRQQLQQEQHQRQLQQRQAQLLQQQQQQQQQLIIEQMLQQQLQTSNFGQGNIDQVLLREQLLNDLHHQPLHFQREHDAAIEQIIQAKYGHGIHREQHNDMLDVLSRSNQRQVLPMEQQILLGLHHDQLQTQQLANAIRQHVGREEERHLSGVWPMDDPGQFIRPGTSPNQRLGQFDLLQSLQRSSSVEHHDHLERNLSLQERLHRGAQGIHSLERSGSLPGGAPLPNPDLVALARHHGLSQLETHGDLYSAGQMPMHAPGVHPQQHRLQEQLSGSHMGRLERNWSDANGQLQNSLMEASRINQLQIEAEKQRRKVEMNLPIDNPHAWASLMSNERNPETDLSDMIHQKLVLQAQQSRGFPDVPVAASFGRKDPSSLFAQPAADNPLRSPVDRLSFDDPLADRSHFAKMGHLGQDGPTSLDSLPNNIEMNRKLGVRSSSATMLDIQRGECPDVMGGSLSTNQLVGNANDVARRKRQGSSANLAVEDTDFSEAVNNWYFS